MNLNDFNQNITKTTEKVSAKLTVVIDGRETVIPFFGTLLHIEACGLNMFSFQGNSNGAPEPAVDIQKNAARG